MADALEDAQVKVANLLQHPDDLVQKLSQIRLKFSNEKAAIDSVLKTSVQTQLDDTFFGLQLLSSSSSLMSSVQINLATIDKISLDARSNITNYPRIKVVSKTHQNFIATRDVVLRFQDLSRDIEKVTKMLEEDQKNLSAPHLLEIHYELYRLEDFRDLTLFRAKSDGASVLQIVQKYFKKLDILSSAFRDYLWSLAKNFLMLIRENQGNVIVRLCKIIEAEERADELVLTAQNIRSSNPQLKDSSEWKIMTENPRLIKNYRSQFLNAIMDKIIQDFVDKVGPHERDVTDSLQTCMFVFEDLDLVMNELGPRFPPKYKIFDFYVIQYHKQVYDLLNRLSNRPLETRDILQVTSWVRDYYRIMNQKFQVTEDLLEPRLLDDREQVLIQEYIKLIKGKLQEWVDRLLVSEEREFIARETPPQTDGDGMYCSDSIVIFFQMINQQLEIAIDASRGGRLLLDVAQECFQIMNEYQKRQLHLLESEAAKFMAGQEIAGGFPEYVITLANNHLKGTEYVETMQKKLESQLNEQYRADASKYANHSLEGFMKVSKKAYHVLMDIMFHDLSPAFAQIFLPPWYDQPQQQMSSIVQTLDDYLQDFKKHLLEYLFTKLTTDCLDLFLQRYLECFRHKNVKFKMEHFGVNSKRDLTIATTFWSEYKTPKRIKQSFDIIEKILALIESSESLIFLAWYGLWKSYSDIPMSFIEEILHKRDDLEKNTIKEVILNCKSKSKEPNSDAVTGLFSKVYPAVGDTAALK